MFVSPLLTFRYYLCKWVCEFEIGCSLVTSVRLFLRLSLQILLFQGMWVKSTNTLASFLSTAWGIWSSSSWQKTLGPRITHRPWTLDTPKRWGLQLWVWRWHLGIKRCFKGSQPKKCFILYHWWMTVFFRDHWGAESLQRLWWDQHVFSHGKSYSEMGFFAVTTAYSVAKRFVGPWLGTAASIHHGRTFSQSSIEGLDTSGLVLGLGVT